MLSHSIQFLVLILILSFAHCSKINPSNICETGTIDFYKTILFKLNRNELSPHCGFNLAPQKLNRTACDLTQSEVIQPENWPLVQAELIKQASLGNDPITISHIQTNELGSEKWGPLTLAKNGFLYAMPSAVPFMLMVDPFHSTISKLTVPSQFTGTHFGGVLALDGKIYSLPYGSSTNIILVFEPSTGNFSSLTYPTNSEDKKWMRGILAPNGKIYYLPGTAETILVLDPATGSTTTIPSPKSGNFKWIGGSLAPNGKIYGAPGIENSVLVINPADNSIYTIPSPFTGSLKWSGFNLGIDGRLYATPLSNNPYYLSLNPTDDSVSLILAPTTGSQRWFGGSLAPSGKIYHSPSNDDSVLEFNSETLGSTLYTQGITGTDKWMPLKLGPNGRMFATPSNADYVLIINSNAKGKYCNSILYSSYMN